MKMRIPLLNLISTVMPVLNTVGLNLRVGLSSEDPMVLHRPSEPYEAYLTTYSPEGVLVDRRRLGQIPPHRRRYFDASAITREFVPTLDHLAVVHRIPASLMPADGDVQGSIEVEKPPEFLKFRALVEYWVSEGGNGSVVYETPPQLNARIPTPERPPSTTLTFTPQVLLSSQMDTYVPLTHYSLNPLYNRVAHYEFSIFSVSGERLVTERVEIGPFAVKVLKIRDYLPTGVIERERDPRDGLSPFTFVGFCDDASVVPLFVSVAPSLGAVSVEHTHAFQDYFPLPLDGIRTRVIKGEAIKALKSLMTPATGS
jgi:hypothetical protein